MSAKDGIRKIEHGDGVTVVDEGTGVSGEGETYPEALENLVERFRAVNETVEKLERLRDAADSAESLDEVAEAVSSVQDTARLLALGEDIQDRFEEEGVTDEDVENAIEWARSQ